MANQRSEKLQTLIMAILTLVMGYIRVAFATGAEPTWFPPVYFGVCSVAYLLVLIVAELEDDDDVKRYADWFSHLVGLLDLAFLDAYVSTYFAIGLFLPTAAVGLWYRVKNHRNNNNDDVNALIVPEESNKLEKLNVLLLAALLGAMVFGQIGLAMGLEKTNLSPIYLGLASVCYVIFRVVEVLEDQITFKAVAGYVSRFAGPLSLVFFVGLISEAFALAIFVSALLLMVRYTCKIWCTNPTPQDLADKVQTLLQPDDLSRSAGYDIV